MNRVVRLIVLTSALIAPSALLAADCDEDTAADLNSRIEANFSIMDVSDSQNDALRQKIETLQQDFTKAGKIHTEALDNHDQAGLNEACGLYQSILETQAGLAE